MTFHLRVSIFVNFVSSGKAGRTTRSFSVKSTFNRIARLMAIMMSMIIGNTILTVVISPPKFVLELTCKRENVVDSRHQNIRLVNARSVTVY